MKMGFWAGEDPLISYGSRGKKAQGAEQSHTARRVSATDASLCLVCVQPHLTLSGALRLRWQTRCAHRGGEPEARGAVCAKVRIQKRKPEISLFLDDHTTFKKLRPLLY